MVARSTGGSGLAAWGAGLLVLLAAGSLAAQELAVPVETQLPVLLKVLTFDRNLQQRAGGELVIAVVYQPRFRGSLLVKEGLERAAAEGEIATVAGVPFRLVGLELAGVDELRARIVELEADVLYLAPLRAVQVEEITAIGSELGRLTLSGVPEYVDAGVAVSMEVVRSRPRLVINLGAAEQQGADFSSRLLNLARVVNEPGSSPRGAGTEEGT